MPRFPPEGHERKREEPMERLRAEIEADHRKAVEDARSKPPPPTVEADLRGFGPFTRGRPPDIP